MRCLLPVTREAYTTCRAQHPGDVLLMTGGTTRVGIPGMGSTRLGVTGIAGRAHAVVIAMTLRAGPRNPCGFAGRVTLDARPALMTCVRKLQRTFDGSLPTGNPDSCQRGPWRRKLAGRVTGFACSGPLIRRMVARLAFLRRPNRQRAMTLL